MSTETTDGVVLPDFKHADKLVAEIKSDGDVDMVQVIEEILQPKPNPTDFVKQQRPKPAPRQQVDPDQYLLQAKALVVQNYNEHRDPSRSPELSMDSVYIIWFAKTLGNWKAVIASSVARGLLWEASFNGQKNEAYLDVYRKLNHTKIPLG